MGPAHTPTASGTSNSNACTQDPDLVLRRYKVSIDGAGEVWIELLQSATRVNRPRVTSSLFVRESIQKAVAEYEIMQAWVVPDPDARWGDYPATIVAAMLRQSSGGRSSRRENHALQLIRRLAKRTVNALRKLSMRGSAVVRACGQVVSATVVLALVIACRAKPAPDAFIKALMAIDRDSAVVVYRERERYSVARIDHSGRLRWMTPIPGDPLTISTYNGLALAGDTVQVRYTHTDDHHYPDHALASFSLRDGRVLWDIRLTRYRSRDRAGLRPATPTDAMSLTAGGGLVAHWANDGDTDWIFGVDAATGEIISKQQTDDDFRSPVAIGSQLVINSSAKTTFFDLTGARPPRTVGTWFRGCGVGDEYMALSFERLEDEQRTLVAYRGANPDERRVIVPSFRLKDDDELHSLQGCGRYGDRLVLHLAIVDRTFIVIADAGGNVLHIIDLGSTIPTDRVVDRYPGVAPLSGDLPRFTPYPWFDGVPRLAMLDLERGVVAWTAADGELAGQDWFRAGSSWYSFNRAQISVFDGNSGALVAAVRFSSILEDVMPYHVADGRLWVHKSGWARTDTPTVAILDATTLVPVFARGIDVVDITPDVRAQIGPR